MHIPVSAEFPDSPCAPIRHPQPGSAAEATTVPPPTPFCGPILGRTDPARAIPLTWLPPINHRSSRHNPPLRSC